MEVLPILADAQLLKEKISPLKRNAVDKKIFCFIADKARLLTFATVRFVLLASFRVRVTARTLLVEVQPGPV